MKRLLLIMFLLGQVALSNATSPFDLNVNLDSLSKTERDSMLTVRAIEVMKTYAPNHYVEGVKPRICDDFKIVYVDGPSNVREAEVHNRKGYSVEFPINKNPQDGEPLIGGGVIFWANTGELYAVQPNGYGYLSVEYLQPKTRGGESRKIEVRKYHEPPKIEVRPFQPAPGEAWL